MRRLSLIAVGLIGLAACGERADARAAAEQGTAAPPVVAVAPAAAPASIEETCRQAVQVQYGQAGEAVTYDAAAGTVSWRAPVDGGRLSFVCAARGAEVTLSRDGQTQTVTLPISATPLAEKEAR